MGWFHDDNPDKLEAMSDIEYMASLINNNNPTIAQLLALKEKFFEAKNNYYEESWKGLSKDSREEYHAQFLSHCEYFWSVFNDAFDNAKEQERSNNNSKFLNIGKQKKLIIGELRNLISSSQNKNIHAEIQSLKQKFYDVGFSGDYEKPLRAEFKEVADIYYQTRKIAAQVRADQQSAGVAVKQQAIDAALALLQRIDVEKVRFPELKNEDARLRTLISSVNAGKELNNQYWQSFKEIMDSAWAKWKSKQGERNQARYSSPAQNQGGSERK